MLDYDNIESQIERMLKLRDEGHTIREIAVILDMPPSTVGDWVIRYNKAKPMKPFSDLRDMKPIAMYEQAVTYTELINKLTEKLSNTNLDNLSEPQQLAMLALFMKQRQQLFKQMFQAPSLIPNWDYEVASATQPAEKEEKPVKTRFTQF